jgi:TANK-binding kinase 1
MNKVQSVRIYLPPERTSGDLPSERVSVDHHPPERTYGKLQSLLQEQTDVAPLHQILLYQESLLPAFIEDLNAGQSYPTTHEDKPLMLLSKENNNVTLASEGDVPKFPTFPTLVSVETDASLAKTSCSVGHACKRRLEKLSQSSLLIHACVQQFTAVVNKDLKSVETKSRKLRDITRYVIERLEAVVHARNTVRSLTKLLGGGDGGSNGDLTAPSHELVSDLAPAVQQLYQRYVTEHVLWNEWRITTCALYCPAKSRSPARARTMVDRLRDSWQHLLRDRATRSLTYNDEQFHVLERIKVIETGRRLRVLLDAECQPAGAQLADALADWYKRAQTVYLQVRILDKDLDAYEKRLEAFSRHLTESDSVFYQNLQAGHDGGTKSVPVKHANKAHQDAKVIHNSFKDIMTLQGEVMMIVKENSQIVTQFQHLTENFLGDGASNGEEK